MFRHYFKQDGSEEARPAVYFSVPRAEEMTENQVEDYLDRLYAPLIGTMAYEDRQRIRAAARAEIDALIAAHEELGSPREQAIALAVEQFQRSRSLASPMPLQQKTARTETSSDVTRSYRLALRLFGGSTLFTFCLLLATGDAITYGHSLNLLWLLMVGLPLIAGSAVGFLAPSRPMAGTLKAMGALFAPTLAFYMLWASLHDSIKSAPAGLFFGGLHCLSWTFIGSITAGLTGWFRKTTHRPGA